MHTYEGDILILGWILAVLRIIAYLFQVFPIYKTKQTKGLSLITFSMYNMGFAFWSIYGAIINSWPNFATNTLLIIIGIPLQYYLYKNKEKLNLFRIYFSIIMLMLVATITIMITRKLEIWGPNTEDIKNIEKRSFYFVALCWCFASLGTFNNGLSFFPQIYKSYVQKSVKVNHKFTLLLTFVQVGWIVFWTLRSQLLGISFSEWLPGLISATLVFICQVILLFMFFAYFQNKKLFIEK